MTARKRTPALRPKPAKTGDPQQTSTASPRAEQHPERLQTLPLRRVVQIAQRANPRHLPASLCSRHAPLSREACPNDQTRGKIQFGTASKQPKTHPTSARRAFEQLLKNDQIQRGGRHLNIEAWPATTNQGALNHQALTKQHQPGVSAQREPNQAQLSASAPQLANPNPAVAAARK